MNKTWEKYNRNFMVIDNLCRRFLKLDKKVINKKNKLELVDLLKDMQNEGFTIEKNNTKKMVRIMNGDDCVVEITENDNKLNINCDILIKYVEQTNENIDEYIALHSKFEE
jgi:hypothetical protein